MLWLGFTYAILAIALYNFIVLPVFKLFRLDNVVKNDIVASVYAFCWSLLSENAQINVNSIGDEHLRLQAPALIICNHQSLVDYLVLIAVCHRSLNGPYMSKFLCWKRIVPIPDLKLLWNRYKSGENWALSDIEFTKQTSGINDDSMFILFPEVNRFTADLQEKHRILCEISGAPVLTHILYPRYTAFQQTSRLLSRNSNIQRLYDITLHYESESPPNLWDVFMGKPITVSLKIDKFTINKLHVNDRKYMDRWLEHRWVIKDKYLSKKTRRKSV